MKIGHPFVFPGKQQALRTRARRLAWLSIALLVSTAVLMVLTLGQSQAMKTAWIEDLLGLIPPISVLISMKVERRPANRKFPYGYHRAVSLAFLATASVLSIVGVWLLFDAVMKLLAHERPPVGTIELFGHQLWLGWAMIAALTYAVAVGLLLGQLKRPVAKDLNNRVLDADADMNRADWMAEGAAIVGLLLVGWGFWWGDSAAAGLISLTIIKDGWDNLRQVMRDLMDESPSVLGSSELESLPDRLRKAAERLDWVAQAAVRLREQGHLITGDVFVVPREGGALIPRLEEAARALTAIDWRLHDLVVAPVAHLESTDPPRT